MNSTKQEYEYVPTLNSQDVNMIVEAKKPNTDDYFQFTEEEYMASFDYQPVKLVFNKDHDSAKLKN